MFIIDWVFDKMGYTKKVHWLTVLNSWEGSITATPKKVATKRKPAVKKTIVRKKMPNEIQKEIVKEAIKEWLNEKVSQFGWFSLRTLFYVFVGGLGYAYLSTHGWSLPK